MATPSPLPSPPNTNQPSPAPWQKKPGQSARVFVTICWVLSACGALMGAFTFMEIWIQTGAPQQAAVAAMAIGWAVIPYCLARAVSEILGRIES